MLLREDYLKGVQVTIVNGNIWLRVGIFESFEVGGLLLLAKMLTFQVDAAYY